MRMMEQAIVEQSLDSLAFEESPAPLVVTQNRYVMRCNRAFAGLFVYTVVALEGELILKLYPCSAVYYEIGHRCMAALEGKLLNLEDRIMQHLFGTIYYTQTPL